MVLTGTQKTIGVIGIILLLIGGYCYWFKKPSNKKVADNKNPIIPPVKSYSGSYSSAVGLTPKQKAEELYRGIIGTASWIETGEDETASQTRQTIQTMADKKGKSFREAELAWFVMMDKKKRNPAMKELIKYIGTPEEFGKHVDYYRQNNEFLIK